MNRNEEIRLRKKQKKKEKKLRKRERVRNRINESLQAEQQAKESQHVRDLESCSLSSPNISDFPPLIGPKTQNNTSDFDKLQEKTKVLSLDSEYANVWKKQLTHATPTQLPAISEETKSSVKTQVLETTFSYFSDNNTINKGEKVSLNFEQYSLFGPKENNQDFIFVIEKRN